MLELHKKSQYIFSEIWDLKFTTYFHNWPQQLVATEYIPLVDE